ncbi:tetratricopeptide repeat protein [Aquipseudomonas campi]|uniref:Tetratricopeptide repeat protein n=1 Tax=Aquipseudomonas campi TaxID=2731681 RepID=A0A6M8FJI7_9GAMM|nr:transglutaminase family protein [Pseudomonas campi]QKE64090.1 tetratricopeptide repeat protein [Pseudomonas campi]
MSSRPAWLDCLDAQPPALFEAALCIAAEHDAQLQPAAILRDFANLRQQVQAGLPNLPAGELAQPLLRRLNELDFHEDDDLPTRPQAALLHRVLQRRRGQPLSLALIALELARQLEIPLHAVNFPGHLLLRVPGADHLLDPCSGRRLYPRDCRELLQRVAGPAAELNAGHLLSCDARALLLRLSRNLCHLHGAAGEPLAALKDAERVLQLAPPNVTDHLVRAMIYRELDCPQAERFDLERALLLCDDPQESLRLSQRLHELERSPALH